MTAQRFYERFPQRSPKERLHSSRVHQLLRDIVQIFEQHADAGPYLPQPQTLWSTGSILRFRCLFTPSLCEALASASRHHAEPELFDHLFLYAGRVPLLEWPDAFSNCMWIASSIPEARISAFAAGLGLRYKYANHG